jgi:hypothetical protein
MNGTEMIEHMNRTPFEPIEIHLTDGTKILVEHPYYIATQPKSSSCFIYDDDERMHFVAYRNITQVITKATAQ